MKIYKEQFADPEQWQDHQKILKMECRVIDTFERFSDLWIFYGKGIADHRFFVRYSGEGSSTLYFEHASYNLTATLKELLVTPNGLEHALPKSKEGRSGKLERRPSKRAMDSGRSSSGQTD